MEVHKRFLGSKWNFTRVFAEVPTKVQVVLLQNSGIDPSRERILATGYVGGFGILGKLFFIITDQRVVSATPFGVEQNLIRDLTGVERGFAGTIRLGAPGNSSQLFQATNTMPPKKLMDTVFAIINTLWNESRQVTPPNVTQASEGETKDCPFCAETIKAAAVVCRYCGRGIK